MALKNKIYTVFCYFFCCWYIDWILATFNEELPDEQWRITLPHPSAVRPSAVEDADADYNRLVNSVERHTRCSSACCWRQKNVGVPAECRFGFPKSHRWQECMCTVHGKVCTKETAHMLLSMPLTGCTYGFVTVSLDNSRKVVIDNENQSD